jgi:hypothetical protein
MILFVPSAAAKTRVSRDARSFVASRKTADPRTAKCSLLVNLDKQPTHIRRPNGNRNSVATPSGTQSATARVPLPGARARDSICFREAA